MFVLLFWKKHLIKSYVKITLKALITTAADDTLNFITIIMIFTLSIGTPYLLTILVLKFEIVYSTTS